MAQIVQLKRSSLSGKVPDTGSLNLGELAINTYDGKIYLRRSGSTDTVQEVITTNTTNTGSINIIGNHTITGSFFQSGSHTITGSVNITGSLTMTGNTLPSITNTYTLGNTSFRYNQMWVAGTLYMGNGTIKGNSLGFGDEVGNISIKIGSTATGGNVAIYLSSSTYVDNGSRLQVIASGSQNALYVTGSSQFTGSVGMTGDLTVLGAVNARQFNISVISSSVIYQSGSTKFGDTSDDIMQVTGSLQVSGSQTITGSVNITGSIYVNGNAVGIAPGPNTYDFNLDPNAAGTVNYITDSTSNTLALAQTGSFDVKISNITRLSVSSSAMWVTTGSITSNYMHLAKYINTAGDLDFNI